jgi:hypothetical protein
VTEDDQPFNDDDLIPDTRAAVDALVASAPPLTDGQFRKLKALLMSFTAELSVPPRTMRPWPTSSRAKRS